MTALTPPPGSCLWDALSSSSGLHNAIPPRDALPSTEEVEVHILLLLFFHDLLLLLLGLCGGCSACSSGRCCRNGVCSSVCLRVRKELLHGLDLLEGEVEIRHERGDVLK